jgi:hypothetical protein
VAWPQWFAAADAVVALGLLVVAFLVASFAARNSDLWPHLAAGRMLTKGEYAFGTDPFSYATEGRTWVNHAWLFDLGAYLLYTADPTGAALVAVKAVGFAAAIGLLLLIRRPGHALWPWVVFAGLAVLAAAPFVALRPAVASVLLLAATLYVLMGLDWKRGSWRNPLVLAGLFWVWANIDGWFVLGPLTVALFLVGEWLHTRVVGGGDAPAEGDPFRPPPPLPDLAKALGVGVLACMLNPHHARVWQLPPELGLGLPAAVATDDYYFPLALSPLSRMDNTFVYFENAAFGGNANGAGYAVLLLGGAAALAAGFGRLRLSHLLLWLAFAFLSLLQFRQILFFAVVAVPLAAGCVNGLSTRIRLGPTAAPATRIALTLSGVGRILTVPALLAMGAAAWPGWLHPRPTDPSMANRVEWAVKPDEGSVRTATMIRDWRQGGRLPDQTVFRSVALNPALADYFAWYTPGEKVLANTRWVYHAAELADLIGVRKALRLGVREGEPPDLSPVRSLFEKNRGAFVVYSDWGPPGRSIAVTAPLTMMYAPPREWMLWYIDGRAAVLGWQTARVKDSAAFDRMRFDPIRIAFDPGLKPLPEPKVARPPVAAGEWWDDFVRTPAPTPLDGLDSTVLLLVAGNVRGQQVAPYSTREFQTTWVPISMAVAGVPAVGPFFAAGTQPLPPPTDEAIALQLMAVRAARRAIAANPDAPDPYFVLAQAARDASLAPPGQDPRELRMIQTAALRQFLDRIPPPHQGSEATAERGRIAAFELFELYRSPAVTADMPAAPMQGVAMLDLSREVLQVASGYVEDGMRLVREEEIRKRAREQAEELKKEMDNQVAQRLGLFERGLPQGSATPLEEKIGQAIRYGLVGKAIQLFREAKADEVKPGMFEIALVIVNLKVRAGLVAEAAEDLPYLADSLKNQPMGDRRGRDVLASRTQRLRGVEEELWRITGDYGKLADATKAVVPRAMTPEERQVVAAVLNRSWDAIAGGQHGAVGGGPGLLTAHNTPGVIPPTAFLEYMGQSQFFFNCGLLAVLEGDILTARERFKQAVAPQGIALPAQFPVRVLSERYLRMIAAAEMAGG